MKRGTAVSTNGQRNRVSLILHMIMDIYVLLILVGQFLVYRNYYFDLLDVKYHYFCICTLGMLALVLLCGIVNLEPLKIFQWHKIWPARIKAWLKGKRICDIISSTDVMVLLYTVTVTVSSVKSPFFYESFWGNQGRYTGAFFLLQCSVVYFCVTRFYRVKGWHIQMFLLSGMAMCLFGISDYFGLDLLHFKVNIDPNQYDSFTSFVGNINTYTACVALVAAMAGVLFASSSHAFELVWYGICVMISYAALITGRSDNAFVSLIAFFGLLPLYLFRNWRGVRRYFLLLAMFGTAMQWVAWTQVHCPDVMRMGGMYNTLIGYHVLPALPLCLWALVAVLYIAKYLVGKAKKDDQGGVETRNTGRGKFSFARIWWLVIIAVCIAVGYMVYDATVLGNGARYGGLEQYVHFRDSWGTGRGIAWRFAVENYMEFPPLQKLIGYGPETYGLLTWMNNLEEMMSIAHLRFDTVHNEFLQMLVTIGLLGLLTYLGILVTAAWRAVRRHIDNPFIMGALFAWTCYSFQTLVNINQVIATPVMWLLLCISAAEPAEPCKWLPWKKTEGNRKR